MTEETIEIIPVPGFYKNEGGNLLCAPNFILFPHGEEWTIENKDEYTYPTLGWYYFDSEELARIFFNLPLPEETNGIQS